MNDRDGGLRMAMKGLTGKDAAAKANDPATKADDPAKASDVDILKKLENAANDAGIKTEAAEVTEVAQSTEKPYIPEAAQADATSGNVLDGSGSNAFKTSNFVSLVEGSPVYESNNTDAANDGTEASFKRGPSVKASKSGIKPEELQKRQAALQPTSGEAIAKAEAKPEARRSANKVRKVQRPKAKREFYPKKISCLKTTTAKRTRRRLEERRQTPRWRRTSTIRFRQWPRDGETLRKRGSSPADPKRCLERRSKETTIGECGKKTTPSGNLVCGG